MNEIESAVESLRWEGNSADPTPEFWSVWRAGKQAVKDLGYSVWKHDNGNWEVRRQHSAAPAVPAVQYPTLVESPTESGVFEPREDGRPAAYVEGFVAPELDPTRNWSDEQRAIFAEFNQGKGNVIVDAKAGTGKTTTIKAGFSQAPEAEILYAVFGKRNQEEAAASITDPRVEIKTLHAVGYRLIRLKWQTAKMDKFIEEDRCEAVVGKNQPDGLVRELVKLVEFAKNIFIWPSVEQLVQLAEDRNIDVSDCAGWNTARLAAAALDVMKLALQRDARSRISFTDMVWLPVAANWVCPLFDLVCVDEAQDMNLPQLLMCIGLCRPGGRIFVVGDPRQAIYAFRGAASDGMGMMKEKLNAKTLTLSTTYRCPKSVVALAANIVPGYVAAPSAPEGQISYLGDSKILDVLQVGDAVLSRANAPLMPICLKLLRRGIPAAIRGRDIGATLAGIVKKLNAKSIPHFMAKIESWGQKQKSRFKADKNYESKCEVIDDQVGCLKAIAEGVASVSEICPRLESMFQDDKGFNKPTVVLSSVHKAKGLEWDRVFLVSKTFRVTSGQDEEANIYYVAVTRAKKELVFVSEDKPKDE